MNHETSCVAVHCFGRHIEAIGWEHHMWLAPDGKLGQVPTALLIALKKGASILSIGTGASEKHGIKEARWTRQYARVHLDELKQHPFFHDADFDRMEHLLETAFTEVKSQNTVEEIKFVFAEYARRSVTDIFAVTNPSHGPRCRRDIDVHVIDQQLRLNTCIVTSETPFDGALIGDTVIMEPPHRGDDTSPPFYKLIPRLFKIPAITKQEFYDQFDNLLKQFGV